MKQNLFKAGAVLTALSPVLVMAQTIAASGGLLTVINGILRAVVPILMTVALIYFIWGLIKYVIAAGKGNDEESKHGKAIMIWGIVALFVMASAWGLVNMLQATFGLTGSQAAPVINIPTSN